ncbi:DUF4384 domain-containing protein [Hoeflea sp. WL0058]|uniref:DUF4384 domain-containing protein n=1 Tax=Flavimaribacter sediminis TaxID=2865987 RepID=A0AAE3D3N1_9HYPH|nr:DUF4384 domain-containing protein [Flavimaribacter sediminis]MBW8640282.1 DUF4384 domain-containing protein [Flavimaribacter sediminis]
MLVRQTACVTLVLWLLGAMPSFSQDFSEYGTGLLPTPPDILATIPPAPTRRAFLPESVDLSDRFPMPGNQGRQGSCVAWAVGYAARSYYDSQPRSGRTLSRSEIPSPAYIYNSLAPSCCGCGTSIFLALDLLENGGSLSFAQMPYDQNKCDAPSSSQKAAANKFKISGYHFLAPASEYGGDLEKTRKARLNLVRQELAFGHPVIFGATLTTTFLGRKTWLGDGSEYCGEERCGSHAMTFTGYDDRKKTLKFINSWSTKWGQNGFAYMTYDAFMKHVNSAYVLRMPFEPEPPKPLPTPTPEDFNISLPDMDCGGVIIEREGRNFKLTGFAGKQEDVDAIKRAVASRDDVTVEVDLRPWPQCETLMTLRNVLADKRKPEVEFGRDVYHVGELLEFDVSMADYQGYLHIAYIQADGKVVNLVQSSPTTLKTLFPSQKLRFGDGKEGRAKFTVSPEPLGEEMVVVIASKSPLFDEKRPKIEVERDFLSALREAVISRPDTSSPERLVTADYFILTTKR